MGILSIFTGGTSTLYKYAAMAAGIMALCIGSFLYGHHVASLAAEVAQQKVVIKADQNQEQLQEFQIHEVTKLVPVIEVKTQVIHDNNTQTQTNIRTLTDDELLSRGWVRAHNASAAGDVFSPTSTIDGAPSTVTAVAALGTVADNYSTCNQIREELIGLQTFERDQQTAIENINKSKK